MYSVEVKHHRANHHHVHKVASALGGGIRGTHVDCRHLATSCLVSENAADEVGL